MFSVPVEREGGIAMQRMTEWGPNGYFVRPDKGGATLVYSPGNEPAQRFEGSIVDRLAAYESLGMEPEIISEMRADAEKMIKGLAKWKQLEKEGLLVILPAKTVFELTWDAGPGCDLVCPVTIDGEGQCDFCDHGKLCAYKVPCRQEHIDRIGKDVFLTEEEANAEVNRRNA